MTPSIKPLILSMSAIHLLPPIVLLKVFFLPFSYGALTITFIDKITKNRFESEIRSGGQTINDILLHVSQSVLPFGGLGQRSGVDIL